MPFKNGFVCSVVKSKPCEIWSSRVVGLLDSNSFLTIARRDSRVSILCIADSLDCGFPISVKGNRLGRLSGSLLYKYSSCLSHSSKGMASTFTLVSSFIYPEILSWTSQILFSRVMIASDFGKREHSSVGSELLCFFNVASWEPPPECDSSASDSDPLLLSSLSSLSGPAASMSVNSSWGWKACLAGYNRKNIEW